ncbi:hypothetical protein [Phytohabitans houttuyneae]|uniref:Uncharacterized protein n=1 Tax=Phytohabitans houttuyneae TaxID=1076126 RepID=A0A6V8KGK2_9ACTN|nr:hypothetical protein [Phytohabitans houttuyneae]GFJ81601.1 hypothetical protein Phou_057810 [Phytohabitans houttuyneae]
MPTTAEKALNDAFLDLVYADQETVDAEFDELIATSWEPPPPAPHPTPADRPPPRRAAQPEDQPPRLRHRPRRRKQPARQRSPPTPRR